MSLDTAIRRLEVLQCQKAKVSDCDTDSNKRGYCKRGLVPVDRSLSYHRAWKKAVDLGQREGESSEEYFVRARAILPCLDPEDECWLVNAFINGLLNEDIQRALQEMRRGNRSMTLLQVYERLRILASQIAANTYNSDCNTASGIGNCVSESAGAVHRIDLSTTVRYQPFTTIAVEDIPGHILVDPVAFQKFLAMDNLRPYYQGSGRYSKESIQILHNEFSQLTEEEAVDVAPLMKASAEIALLEGRVSQENRFAIPALNSVFSSTLADGYTIEDLGGVKTNMRHNINKAETKPMEIKPMGIASGASRESLKASEKQKVWGITDREIESYQNATGEKKLKKWREKGEGQHAVVREKDVSTMDMDTEMGSITQDLFDSGGKQQVGEAAGQLDAKWANSLALPVERESWAEEKHDTAEEPHTGYQPTTSNDFSGKAIRNPGVKHIRTARQWDPGPGKSTYTTPAILRNPKGIAVKPMSCEPVHPVAEFPWLLQLRFQWACHNSRMKSRCNCYEISARFVSRIGRTLIGGDGRRQVWDPGGKEVKFNSVVQSGRMGRTDWQADRAGSEQRARARGACQEASIWDLRCLWSHRTVPGICWLRALFVCVGGARWER